MISKHPIKSHSKYKNYKVIGLYLMNGWIHWISTNRAFKQFMYAGSCRRNENNRIITIIITVDMRLLWLKLSLRLLMKSVMVRTRSRIVVIDAYIVVIGHWNALDVVQIHHEIKKTLINVLSFGNWKWNPTVWFDWLVDDEKGSNGWKWGWRDWEDSVESSSFLSSPRLASPRLFLSLRQQQQQRRRHASFFFGI